MKTIVKIDPNKEYDIAKEALVSLAAIGGVNSNISTIDNSIDNLKTVINVLIERATPKKRVRPPKKTKKKNIKNKRGNFDKLPSEKFPDLEVTEKIIKAKEIPKCSCCYKEMKESGLFKTSEKLEVIPKQYHIIKNKRVIYNCSSCNGSMINAPSVPSIARNSNYGDSVVIDVALSKYCDLIPLERCSAIAARDGVASLPANSLIELTHKLALFLGVIYEELKEEVLNSKIILGDETPHKMLEGDDTSNWYLWGFSCKTACVFEAHGTRSGNVVIQFLSESTAKYLVTDGYSGYKRALKELSKENKIIIEVYCNAHAYRYFEQASATWKDEVEVFLELYGEIYELEREAEGAEQKQLARQKMFVLFEKLKFLCEETQEKSMPHSSHRKAINYFLNHYTGLTECINDIDIPLDNNFSERLLRSPVVGRKTWYGTHSKRGANTNAILFSLVESCKLNKINPRNYFPWVVERIHQNKKILTPYQYLLLTDSG